MSKGQQPNSMPWADIGLVAFVFSVLLWGRNRLGWRGHKAIRWTLAGFCLLMLAYFGSKLVQDLAWVVLSESDSPRSQGPV